MRKLFTFFVMVAISIAAYSQNELVEGDFQVGDSITINGEIWLVGPNLITNPSFEIDPAKNGGNIVGWNNATYQQMTTSTFLWYPEGGHDGGAYIQANKHTGSAGDGSIGQRWTVEPGEHYYFSFWLSHNSANNQYIPVVTLTNAESTAGGQNEKLSEGAKQLIGKNGEDSGEILGYGNFIDADGDGVGEWAQTGMVFESDEYTYLQYNARWLKENKIQACFDDFHLHKLYDPETTKPETIAFISLQGTIDEFNTFMGDDLAEYYAFQQEASDWLTESGIEDMTEDNTLLEIQDAIKAMNDKIAVLKGAVANTSVFDGLMSEAEMLLVKAMENPYPGFEEFNSAFEGFTEYRDNGYYPDNDAVLASDFIVTQIAAIKKAMNDYRFSQEASQDNPADYTFLIQSPEFLRTEAEPTYDEEMIPTYPFGDTYAQGSSPAEAASNGWYIGSAGGDQRTNFVQGRACWNAWRNTQGFDEVRIAQELSDIPNGYYTVSALMITQTGCITDQHIYATSSADSQTSPVLTSDTWNSASSGYDSGWDFLTTEKVVVSDGKLTIGALGHGSNELPTGGEYTDYRAGWFCVTHFVLKYYGPLDDEALVTIYNNKVANCEAYADNMGFAADKAEFKAAIEANKGASTPEEINAALVNINAAYATAQASQTEYDGVLAGSYANLKDSIANSYPENCKQVAQKIVDIEAAFLASDTASYKASGAKTAILRMYRDNLLPLLKNCESMAYDNAKAQECMNANIACVVRDLTAITDFPTADEINEQIAHLNKALSVCEAEVILAERGIVAGDITFLIQNPTIENTATNVIPKGWDISMTNSGNGLYTNTGQQYDGQGGYYLDAWNGTAGALLYTASQTLDNIPNGTYRLDVMARTSSDEGFYVFAKPNAEDEGALFNQLTREQLNYTKYVDATVVTAEGTDSVAIVTDSYGSIWTSAAEYLKTNCDIEYLIDPETGYDLYNRILDFKEEYPEAVTEEVLLHMNIASANTGKGFGWQYRTIEFEVTNHKAIIGVTSDSTFTAGYKDVEGKDCVPFTGTWVSADNWQLTLLNPGNNDNWSPVTGIEEVTVNGKAVAAPSASFNLAGQSVTDSYRGIVIRNGRKYLRK